MDNPTQRGEKPGSILIGSVAVIGAMIVACAAWAVIGLFVARTLALGIILLPLISGCAAGLLLRIGGRGLGRRVGIIAVIATLVGCVIGDFIWLALVPNQSSIEELLTTQLVDTLNVLFNLQKAVMYAVAGYLAYAISNPLGTSISD